MRKLIAGLAVLMGAVLPDPAAARSAELGIGDPAPSIQVDEWVKGGPISEFEPGKTYVVEFWATWCGPCRTSIPHLTELQEKYEDEGLEVIGVSVFENDYSGVEPFVEEMGEQMDYNVAIDEVPEGAEDGAMAANWMEAAEQPGIPTAFIVKDDKIHWIGHPMAIDEPLAQVIAGEFDLEAAAAAYREQQAMEEKMTAMMERLQEEVDPNDYKGALAIVNETIEETPALEGQLWLPKLTLMAQAGDTEGAIAYGKELVDGRLKDEPGALNQLAWMIVQPNGPMDLGQQGATLAESAAERANELVAGEDPDILDTLARAEYKAGKLDEALEHQQKAVELSDGEVPDFQQRLEHYEAAAEQGGN